MCLLIRLCILRGLRHLHHRLRRELLNVLRLLRHRLSKFTLRYIIAFVIFLDFTLFLYLGNAVANAFFAFTLFCLVIATHHTKPKCSQKGNKQSYEINRARICKRNVKENNHDYKIHQAVKQGHPKSERKKQPRNHPCHSVHYFL